MAHRSADGRFAVVPGKVAKPRQDRDRTLITDQRRVLARRVKAVGDTLRDALRQQGHTLTATLDLSVVALARIAVRLEIVQVEVLNGAPVDDEQLVRLSNALARGLAQLGLRPTLLEPAKPPPNLSVYLARRQERPAS